MPGWLKSDFCVRAEGQSSVLLLATTLSVWEIWWSSNAVGWFPFRFAVLVLIPRAVVQFWCFSPVALSLSEPNTWFALSLPGCIVGCFSGRGLSADWVVRLFHGRGIVSSFSVAPGRGPELCLFLGVTRRVWGGALPASACADFPWFLLGCVPPVSLSWVVVSVT